MPGYTVTIVKELTDSTLSESMGKGKFVIRIKGWGETCFRKKTQGS